MCFVLHSLEVYLCFPSSSHRRFLITFRHYDFFGSFAVVRTSVALRATANDVSREPSTKNTEMISGVFNKLHIRAVAHFREGVTEVWRFSKKSGVVKWNRVSDTALLQVSAKASRKYNNSVEILGKRISFEKVTRTKLLAEMWVHLNLFLPNAIF